MTADFLKKTNLYLTGVMGAGKTTVGRKLAHRIGYRFLDTDELVEQSAGMSINDIFATSGEAAFRELETEVLAQVSAYTSLVVATGGGIVTQTMNWSYLRHGIVIWLDVPIHILVSRLANDTTRPLLQGEDLAQKLKSTMAQRHHLYAQADIRILYEGRSLSRTCDRILEAIAANIRPDPQKAAGEVVVSQPSINPPAKPLTEMLADTLAQLADPNAKPGADPGAEQTADDTAVLE